MADRRVRTSDGLQLAVREWGDPSRSTVLLVHGFPDTSAVWRLVAEALVDHGFHVAAHDVRGAGRSDAPASLEGYAIDRLVDDIATVAGAVSPDRPVHLVGHDWGSIQGWEAILSAPTAERIASFTSMSGPPLGHVGRWMRSALQNHAYLTLLRQGIRSSYVGFFHVPGLARLASAQRDAIGRTRGLWGRALARVDGARVDEAWPAPTLGADVAHGMQLYRANIGPKLHHPTERRTDVPVQLIEATNDRFVPGWLLADLEEVAPQLHRRTVRARHWVIRSQPVDVAAWIAEHAFTVDGAEAGSDPADR
ncbi:MAG: alpha/beta fold hydrolase [Acidimicrobiales bacterium]|nr:alpha/beta fold hydrolase [Acidimicrobiales bacterium]